MLAEKDPELDCSMRCREAALVRGPSIGFGWQTMLTAAGQGRQGMGPRGTAVLLSY